MAKQEHRGLFVGAGAAGAGTLADFRRQADTRVAAVVDPSPGSVRRLELPPDIPAYPDLDSALREVRADVAFISSPTNRHAEQFIACTRRGMHVWVEKPAALSLEDVLAMVDAARSAGVKALVPFGSFIHYYLSESIELLRSGRLGRLIQVEAIGTGSYGYASEGPDYHYAVRQPEVSGGWIFHHLCHMVDWATQIGGAVESVYSQTQTTVPDPKPNQEEAVTAILRFRGGGTATLSENQLRHIHIRYAVTGDRGGQFIAAAPESRGPDESFLTIETAIGKDASRQALNFDAYSKAVAERPSPVRRFLDAIDRDLPSPVPLERAVENIRICLALRESARTGAVVRIPPSDEGARS